MAVGPGLDTLGTIRRVERKSLAGELNLEVMSRERFAQIVTLAGNAPGGSIDLRPGEAAVLVEHSVPDAEVSLIGAFQSAPLRGMGPHGPFTVFAGLPVDLGHVELELSGATERCRVLPGKIPIRGEHVSFVVIEC